VKPKVRSLLRLLAMHAGRPAHREVLAEALWPDADVETGLHNLHVAVSSLRQVLDPVAGPGAGPVVRREGDAYRLCGAEVDLAGLAAALAAGRRARAAADTAGARAALGRALELYGGELLGEEGPAEWVVRERERYRAMALEACSELAAACVDGGDLVGAVFACERALSIDRDWDPAWRLLIELHERAGDGAAATRARRRYAEVLGELGVSA
jgi:DNA-binding SARP family transcriptional activator